MPWLIAPEELRRLRIDEGLSVKDIAERFGVSPKVVTRRCSRWKIRAGSEQLATERAAGQASEQRPDASLWATLTREQLYRLRVDEKMAMYRIARQFGVGEARVRRRLEDWKIPKPIMRAAPCYALPVKTPPSNAGMVAAPATERPKLPPGRLEDLVAQIRAMPSPEAGVPSPIAKCKPAYAAPVQGCWRSPPLW